MDRDDALAAVAAVRDPVRRALYELVTASAEPVSRDRAAAALHLPRSTAAFHLDQLVTAGLLTVERRRLSGRTGPGAGRPANVYSRAEGEVAISLPARRYELMAEVFATALEDVADGAATGGAGATGGAAADAVAGAVRRVAGEAGAEAVRDAGSLDAVLAATGYEPRTEGRDVVLTNCPFHHLVGRHTGLVCDANHAFLCGAASAEGRDPAQVVLQPEPGRCCVRIVG
jgi:predicted ArsR family transcriptional regulator